ncbi:MAG TPA: S28 family serine protease [Prolixibacteraceae bacterium]|nr:S28 family serine protease [Prolixibacteraceae bacterium]
MCQSIIRKGISRAAVLSFFILFVFQSLVAQSLLERIQALPDIISVEKMEQNPFFSEAYLVNVKQPVDHNHPEKGTFSQRVMLSHLAYDRPVVFVTEGYGGGYAVGKRHLEELCPLLQANQIFVEHRYFGKSRPDSVDWADLTVENAAADQHHIVGLFKKIYTQKWVSTGISKGGETALYHRMLYPGDVDISVPFVAPLNFSVEEKRHPRFIQKKAGTRQERKMVREFQMDVLRRKDRLMPMFEQLCKEKNFHFKAPEREIFDYSVLEFSFSFWQWGHSVKGIPARSATDREVFDYFQKISSSDYFDIESGKANAPFFVQAHMQLGYYAYDTKPFKRVIETKNTNGYIERLFLNKEQVFPYNPEMSLKTDRFLKTSANKVLLIYGGIDPWSASAANGGKNKGVVVMFQPGGSHRSRISNMPEPLRQKATDILKVWLQ